MPEYQGGYRGSQPTYMPPAVGVNLLLYLQDMDITTGPLRESKRACALGGSGESLQESALRRKP